MNRQRLPIFISLLSLLSLLSLPTACSQVGAMADVAQVKTPSSAQSSASDYETLLNRVNELEKRVARLEQKPSQSNIGIIIPTTPSPQNSFETELHNIQTAVMAMLADSAKGTIDNSRTGINDLDLVTAGGGAFILSDYMTGLNGDNTVKSGCKYDFAKDGTVTQRLPATYIPSSQDYEKELHNVQTAVMAMMADAAIGTVTIGTGVPQTDMHKVQTLGNNRMLYLSDYLTGLNGTSIQSGCKYVVAIDGTVTQIKP